MKMEVEKFIIWQLLKLVVHEIVHGKLGYRQVQSHRVPKQLTEEQLIWREVVEESNHAIVHGWK